VFLLAAICTDSNTFSTLEPSIPWTNILWKWTSVSL
jgi:hypothetical protein